MITNKLMSELINKTALFGDSNYNDFTKHKNKERKPAYIARHKQETIIERIFRRAR